MMPMYLVTQKRLKQKLVLQRGSTRNILVRLFILCFLLYQLSTQNYQLMVSQMKPTNQKISFGNKEENMNTQNESTNQSLTVVENENPVELYVPDKLSLERVQKRVDFFKDTLKTFLVKGTHYGTIPGCGTDKVLFKSGAELIGLIFKLAPHYEIQEVDLGEG